MVRITKVYTRQGDRGTTRLAGGQELAKDEPRIEAYGTVDELNSVIGTVLASSLGRVPGEDPGGASVEGSSAPAGGRGPGPGSRTAEILRRVQNDLFHLGSVLATLPEDRERFPGPEIEGRHVEALEEWIDQVNRDLPALESFVLPGGSPAAARLHVARCVCRRAERRVVTLRRRDGDEAVPELAVRYLNRLSDLLFVLARHENHSAGVPEPVWDSRA
ncbi:MAG: cob(I)yrinic acid a,c-diamide adenosyltransferase, partial [Thermoanaerobaculia bacterium]